jgi:hypothetical protein
MTNSQCTDYAEHLLPRFVPLCLVIQYVVRMWPSDTQIYPYICHPQCTGIDIIKKSSNMVSTMGQGASIRGSRVYEGGDEQMFSALGSFLSEWLVPTV